MGLELKAKDAAKKYLDTPIGERKLTKLFDEELITRINLRFNTRLISVSAMESLSAEMIIWYKKLCKILKFSDEFIEETSNERKQHILNVTKRAIMHYNARGKE